MKALFLDTNIFLQCRDLKDLPWNEVADGDYLQLLIPRVVEEEIDKQKSEGNTRRGKRARNASALFREIVLSEEPAYVLRASNPRVEISFPDIDLSGSQNIDLDLTRPDNRIINEVYIYKSKTPDTTVELLTNDTYPIRMCKKLGIGFIIVPDGWILPPEPDARDKKIAEIERKIAKIESAYPQIEVVTYNKDNNEFNSANLQVNDCSLINESEIDLLVQEATERWPLKTNFDEEVTPNNPYGRMATSNLGLRALGYTTKYEKPSEKEISQYIDTSYPKWIEDQKSFYKNLHSKVGFEERHLTIVYELVNNGTVPAENLVIEFSAFGGLLITSTECRDKLLTKINIELPSAPMAPKGRWVEKKLAFSHLDHLNALGTARLKGFVNPIYPIPNIQRDINSFYWKEGKKESYSKKISYECQEFRHQVEPEMFELVVFVPSKEKVTKGGISCLVTAKNIPNPVKITFPISVNYIPASTLDVARQLLDKALPPLLKSKKT